MRVWILTSLSTVLISFNSWAMPVGSYRAGLMLPGLSGQNTFLKYPFLEPVSPPHFQFSSDKLIATLIKIGAWVNHHWKGEFRLKVGDISRPFGGKIARHHTHQNGLDVDIGYLPITAKKPGHRWRHYHNKFTESFVHRGKLSPNFDLQKNYELIDHILTNYDVSKIYVSCAIKQALLSFESWKNRIHSNDMFRKVYAFRGHHDHFHLRLKCPDSALHCTDDRPAKGQNKCHPLYSHYRPKNRR